MIILALITLGVALTLYFNTTLLKNIKNKSTPSSEPSVQAQPSPISDAGREPNGSAETANWKIYENKYFVFKYPPNWFYESPSWLPQEENVSFFMEGTKADHSDGDHKGNEVFIFGFGAQGDTVDKIRKDYYPNAKEITVASRKAIKISESHVIISISSDRIMNISGQNLSQILATFRFLD
ncbi:MAG: hypothetical protein ACD_57C00345G0005 [uncultured bacterium]|nr:MAG: hypothetical protein ACD_57C00345G0005 [uncultured bacterium]KKR61585.1 MAG: hypothetical protein UU00_C0011G0011 [Microgenomates group bacterium GW2011_GWC1_40_35]KKS01262.1 MAG: hypothetical protein UU53_C0015G0016 [Candidatus Curtissbacteria bacterium GW2011_GWC2_41_21]OGD91284.1 MAG: hypothetical protein A3E14_04480 [Candidatus Curtissbacteria bacterium RIFCSPHIGHO2_12_FULL_41_13]